MKGRTQGTQCIRIYLFTPSPSIKVVYAFGLYIEQYNIQEARKIQVVLEDSQKYFQKFNCNIND